MNDTDQESINATATQNILVAAREFMASTPRFCELMDKEKAGVPMDDDEQQELRWLRVLSTNLNLLA